MEEKQSRKALFSQRRDVVLKSAVWSVRSRLRKLIPVKTKARKLKMKPSFSIAVQCVIDFFHSETLTSLSTSEANQIVCFLYPKFILDSSKSSSDRSDDLVELAQSCEDLIFRYSLVWFQHLLTREGIRTLFYEFDRQIHRWAPEMSDDSKAALKYISSGEVMNSAHSTFTLQ